MRSPRRVLTKFDKERQREDIRLLVFAGYSIRDAARQAGVNEATALTWAANGKWGEQIKRIKELAENRQSKSITAHNVALDIAAIKKETRNTFARSSLKVAKWIEKQADDPQGVEVLFEHASAYKAHVDSAAKVAGDWASDEGNRFAVSLSLNAVVNSGQIIELPDGATIRGGGLSIRRDSHRAAGIC